MSKQLLTPNQIAFAACMFGVTVVSFPASARAAPTQHVVTMSNMSFGRIPSNLKVGDTVIWVNRDTVQHTVTARDKSFDLRTGPGGRVKLVLQKPGTIAIYCLFHPAMRGTIKVAAQ